MYHQFLILKNLFSSPIELVRFVEETRLLFSMACPQLRPHHPQTKIKERRKISLKELVSLPSIRRHRKLLKRKNRISLWCKPPEKKKKKILVEIINYNTDCILISLDNRQNFDCNLFIDRPVYYYTSTFS